MSLFICAGYSTFPYGGWAVAAFLFAGWSGWAPTGGPAHLGKHRVQDEVYHITSGHIISHDDPIHVGIRLASHKVNIKHDRPLLLGGIIPSGAQLNFASRSMIPIFLRLPPLNCCCRRSTRIAYGRSSSRSVSSYQLLTKSPTNAVVFPPRQSGNTHHISFGGECGGGIMHTRSKRLSSSRIWGLTLSTNASNSLMKRLASRLPS